MSAHASSTASQPAVGPDLLIVDQDAATRGLLREFLGRAGFTTDEAPDAESALARAAWSEPAAIVLHDGVSGAQGLEILQTLRAEHPALPVVFIADFGAATRAASSGLDPAACLAKPFRVPDLMATVRRALAPAAPARLAGRRTRQAALEPDRDAPR
jgi:DNA-binding response OmpR family regulator